MAAQRSRSNWLDPWILLSFALLMVACGGGSNSSGNSSGGGGGTGTTNNPSTANEWTWVRGADADSPTPFGWPGPGSEPYNSDPWYGTLGLATPYNAKGAGTVPGGRNASAYWADKSGNFWLFGGEGLDANLHEALLNDLWEYNVSTDEWTWIGGSSTTVELGSLTWGQPGIYGTQGSSAGSNIPGSREFSVSWTDSTGTFWLFGGIGFDSTGTSGSLNDLWQFSPTTKEWTWISGSNTLGPNTSAGLGVFGTKGTPAQANVPPGLGEATSWLDNNNNLWLFGGTGPDSVSGFYIRNNLWEFNPSTKEWTWVSGAGAASGGGSVGAGIYGTIGVPAASNMPGCRDSATAWTDGSGNLWLFGGFGCGPVGPGGLVSQNDLNDLWEFNPTTKQWTWMAGDAGGPFAGPLDMFPAPAQYGTLGVAAAGNTPGGRSGAGGWIDSSGDLWLFGGEGVDANGAYGWLNDLWKFNPATNQWAWMGGASIISGSGPGGIYGVEGTPAASNIPGGRSFAATWKDPSGNFWLFAGDGLIVPGNGGTTALNDLWRYEP